MKKEKIENKITEITKQNYIRTFELEIDIMLI